ncbi:MAG: hypothetical protein IJ794_01480 [Lachnospiraceae bacterium]|nr:hypothetical protein [Lachnospiraceae bacterium]
MNITFQNQINKSDASIANYTESVKRAPIENRQVKESVQVNFSAVDSNLNLGLGMGQDDREKKSFLDIQQEAAYTDVGVQQDYMTLMANTMSAEDFHKMSEEGFDFSSMDPEKAVTIVDKIKAELVRSGQQIAGYTDDLDMDTLSAAVGSDSLARALTESFQEADLPLTGENIEALSKAWDMAQMLVEPTDGTYRYMVDNRLEPEIWNVYLAQSSGAGYAAPGSAAAGQDMSYLADEGIRRQIDQVLEQAGQEINEENRERAKWLLSQDLPLTEESLENLAKIKEAALPVSEEMFAQAAAAAVAEGKDPIHASLTGGAGENIYKKAAEILDYYQSQDAMAQADQLAMRKQLEEIRLRMTAEVNVKLLKSGFAIDTAPMEQMIEALREAEELVAGQYFPQDAQAVSKYENWNQTNQAMRDIPQMPAQIVGTIRIGAADGAESTIFSKLHEDGMILRQTYERAGESYESLMTAPRADLGDSMRKAFGNVEDLAREVGLEPVEENFRAIRILGYNHMEITLENVERIKEADTQLQELIRKMTPAATLQMIRDGVNPLEQSLDQLNAYFDSLPEDYQEQAESYSRYLYGLEQNHQITQEERDSYIGVYRLLHQIEKKDGAAIGAVVNTQAELQFSNLLSAVRSGKFRHMDVKASDEYGTLKELVQKVQSVSISEQISRGYEENRLKELRNAVVTERAVTQMLERGETPASAENLLAARKLATNEDNPYRTLRRAAGTSRPAGSDGTRAERVRLDSDNLGAVGANGEVPDDMRADVLDTAEVLWDALSEKESFSAEYGETIQRLQEEVEEITMTQVGTSLDVRAMQLAHRQLTIMGNLARREEYFLSMKVGGEESLVHLTMEEGNAQKGSISIAVDFGDNSHIEAHLQVKQARVEGFLLGKTTDEVTKLQEASDIFYNLISENTDFEAVKLPVLSSENINMTRMSGTDSKENDNGALYHVAKLFLQAIQ